MICGTPSEISYRRLRADGSALVLVPYDVDGLDVDPAVAELTRALRADRRA